MRHAPAIDIVRQMVDDLQPRADRMAIDAVFIDEINVVNRKIVAVPVDQIDDRPADAADRGQAQFHRRSEEHTSELQSLMRTTYAVFCLKKKKSSNKCTPRLPPNT